MSLHAPPHAWWLLTFGLCWLCWMRGRKAGWHEAYHGLRVAPVTAADLLGRG